MLQLVKERHLNQFRNGVLKVPYWMHCYGVANMLENMTMQYDVGINKSEREVLYLAALGHDLYEDTITQREEICSKFGKEVDSLIFELTNEVNDLDREAYMSKLSQATDRALLIKLADMLENTTSVYYFADYLGAKWISKFFLPIMNDTLPAVTDHKFHAKWSHLADALNKIVASNIGLIESRLSTLDTKPKDD